MSRKELVTCDQCGTSTHKGSGKFHTDYDPDWDDGWWHLSVTEFTSKEKYDFCSLKCVAAWTAETSYEQQMEEEHSE